MVGQLLFTHPEIGRCVNPLPFQVHWTHLPIALYPDDRGYIFSGSAVVDWSGSAGFGPEAMVAVFTYDGEQQEQAIAYSLDKGR